MLTVILSAPLVLAEEEEWVDDYVPMFVTVDTAFINMHTGPGSSYPIFYVAERGEEIEIMKSRAGWFKVRNRRDITGWVSGEEITLTVDSAGNRLVLDEPSLETYSNQRWEGGMLVGDYGGADALTFYGGYQFTRNLSLELSLSQTYGEFSNSLAYNLNIVHQFAPQWRVSPFFTIGGGIRETEPSSTLVSVEDRKDSSANVGGGVKIYLNKQFFLRLQYTSYLILTSRDNDEDIEEWTIGLSAFF